MEKETIKQVINGLKRILLYLLLLLLLLFLHIEFYEYAADDAYIHFRVVRNFVEQGKPYYNHDEPLKVSTSSGWMVFISCIFAISSKLGLESNFPLIVAILNAMILAMILFLYTHILGQIMKKDLSARVWLLFQIPCVAVLLPTSLELMETPFALLIFGIGIYFVLRKNVWGFIFLSFAAHIRPEMLALLMLAVFMMLFYERFKLIELVKPVLIGLTPMVLFDLYYFNTVIPHSVVAKKVIYSFTFFETFISAIFGALPSAINPDNTVLIYIFGFISSVVFFCSLLIINLVALLKGEKNDSLWPLFWGYSSLLTVSGYVLGRAFIFNWYRPLYMLPAILSLTIFSFSRVMATRRIARAAMVMILLASLISLSQSLYATIGNRSYCNVFATGARVKTYLEVAKILYSSYPEATLLTFEIGGTGFNFRGKVFDAAGLASADAVQFHPLPISDGPNRCSLGTIPPKYVEFKNPDIIVSHDAFAKALQASEVIRQYSAFRVPIYLPEDAIYSASRSLWGSKYHNIYIKRSLPISKDLELFMMCK